MKKYVNFGCVSLGKSENGSLIQDRLDQGTSKILSGKGFFVVLRCFILHALPFVYFTLCIIMRVACQALKGASYYTKHKIFLTFVYF